MDINLGQVELVKDINPDISGSSPGSLAEFNDRLYFSANDGTDIGSELWVSNGTTEETQLLANINTNDLPEEVLPEGSYPANLTESDGKLYFSAIDGADIGKELWVTDGTAEGTNLVKDIDDNTASLSDGDSNPTSLTDFQGKLYFTADDGKNGRELWVSDGTAEGTNLLKDINPEDVIDSFAYPQNGSSNPDNFTEFNDKLYFSAADNNSGSDDLWVTDGTTEGTQLVSDRVSSSGNSSIYDVATLNNKLYFSVDVGDSGGAEIWVSDGTAEGTEPAVDVIPGFDAGVDSLIEFNDKLYFAALDRENGFKLWQSDGTTQGTQQLTDADFDSANFYPSGKISDAAEFNGKLYFTAFNTENGRELWATNGENEGTQLVADINPNIIREDAVSGANSSPADFTVVGDELLFTADNGATGDELFKLTADGSTVTEISESTSELTIDEPEVAIGEAASSTVFLGGTDEADNLVGTEISERIEGGAGDDSLLGAEGNDILIGGADADFLTGGAGEDIFGISSGTKDTIVDFELGSDRLGLSDGLTLEELSFVGNNIQLGDTILTTLTDIDTSSLTADDFTII